MTTSVRRSRRPRPRRTPAASVFINCRFDSDFQPLFRSLVFAVIDCGFIRCVRDWLRTMTRRQLPGGADIYGRFQKFEATLPALAAQVRLRPEEVTYPDLLSLIANWLDETNRGPA